MTEGPIRILHVMDSLGTGGLENGVVNLIQHMDAGRFEHVICTIRGLGANASRLPAGRARLLDLAYSSGTHSQTAALRRVIREVRPDIVHSRNWGAIEGVVAARLCGCYTIHSEHGLETTAATREPRRRIILRRLAFKLAHRVLCVSKNLRDFHSKRTGFPARRMGVIHNGVDASRFSPDREARARMRRELGIGEAEFCIGSVGNLLPVKDQMTLLRALQQLAEAARGWRVLIAGEGPERRKLEAFAAGMASNGPRICFLGQSGRVPELLNTFDVYVLSSVHEGISNSLLEAMASGVPVIATDTGGNPEVVEQGTGKLFPAGEAGCLATELLRLHDSRNLCAELGAAGRRRVREQFSIESMVHNYERVYEQFNHRTSQPARAEVQA